ncbi:sce7726 family protein [Listeria booriae]|nr:sce7726 family protein [Listeria booriae]MBC2172101.1 sce7726 family protein [Listeria booriae]
MYKMKDSDLRILTLRKLATEYSKVEDTKIINEMGLFNGASRIDIAVVNGVLHGYELKSESDNLKRLPRQIDYYNKIFERMTIVTDRKYLSEVREMVPSWWGIIITKKNRAELRTIRKGRKGNCQDEEALLNLLWKDEYDGLIDLLGYPKNMKKMRKKEVFEVLLVEKRKSIIKKYIYDALRKRNYN